MASEVKGVFTMSEIDIKQLFDAGAHFGHKTARWNPKMAKYIYGKQGDTHVIDLAQTVEKIAEAKKAVSDIANKGKQVLFVGTKRQARDVIKASAEKAGMPYVSERWLGGMLTNSATMMSQIKKLKLMEKRMASGELASRYNKLEVQRFQEEIDTLNNRYGGVKEMKGKPGAVFVIDAVADHNAIKEANKLNIPVIAICDTNANPDTVDYVIPANDDAIAAIQLIANQIADAIIASSAAFNKNNKEK